MLITYLLVLVQFQQKDKMEDEAGRPGRGINDGMFKNVSFMA